jgi:hypothetical protein
MFPNYKLQGVACHHSACGSAGLSPARQVTAAGGLPEAAWNELIVRCLKKIGCGAPTAPQQDDSHGKS